MPFTLLLLLCYCANVTTFPLLHIFVQLTVYGQLESSFHVSTFVAHKNKLSFCGYLHFILRFVLLISRAIGVNEFVAKWKRFICIFSCINAYFLSWIYFKYLFCFIFFLLQANTNMVSFLECLRAFVARLFIVFIRFQIVINTYSLGQMHCFSCVCLCDFFVLNIFIRRCLIGLRVRISLNHRRRA